MANEELTIQIKALQDRLAELEARLNYDNFSDLEVKKKATRFVGNVGFYDTEPIVQPATVSDPAGQADDLDSEARTAINAIISRLKELGLIASS